jgi:hypothetical protein
MPHLNKCKLLINEGFTCLTATGSWAQEAKGKFNVAYQLSSDLRAKDDESLIKVFSIWGLILVNLAAKNGDAVVKLMKELMNEDQSDYNMVFDSVEPFLKNGCSDDDIASVAKYVLKEYF